MKFIREDSCHLVADSVIRKLFPIQPGGELRRIDLHRIRREILPPSSNAINSAAMLTAISFTLTAPIAKSNRCMNSKQFLDRNAVA